VAIAGDRIFAVGSDKDVLNLATARTRKVDLTGRTLVPGFIDAHTHVSYSGIRHLKQVDCDLRSIADIQKAIRARAAKTPPGQWVIGFKYDDTKTSDARKLGGMEFPIAYEYNAELPNFYDQFIAGVYSRGGDMFDADLNPLFADPDSAAFKQLQWIADTYAKGLVYNEPNLSNIVTAMGAGKHAFVVCYNYILAALNNAADQPLAGQFALAPMPGDAHNTFGFAKFYAMTAAAAADPAKREASWKLIEFMAGKPYTVAKLWALQKGLGFGQLPLLDDPEVIEAWGKWVDIPTLKNQIQNAKVGTWTEWTAVWAAQFRPLLAEAMVGDIPVEEAMTEGAAQWSALKEKMKK
jgi:ABC-type glycerol-3-phosphate transport system substrate-binding protein